MGYSSGSKQGRVGFMDELRGFDLLLMIAYHAGYDLVFIFGIDVPFYQGPIMRYVQPMIAGIFIVLSGISCRYSRSNAKRGLRTLALGMLLTVVTLIFIPGQAIYFGILHFLGTAMLLYALLGSEGIRGPSYSQTSRQTLDVIPAFWGLLLSVFMFAVTHGLPDGYIGIRGAFTIRLPIWLYSQSYLLPLGFAGAGADYFPIIPYIFLYFAGCYAGVFFTSGAMPGWLYRSHAPWLSKIGRRAIVIYMLHQPVTYGVIWAVLWVAGKLHA